MSLISRLFHRTDNKTNEIRSHLNTLYAILMQGSDKLDYQKSLEIISGLRKYSPSEVHLDNSTKEEWAAGLAYSLVTSNHLLGPEPDSMFLAKHLLCNFERVWWLECFCSDSAHPKEVRELARENLMQARLTMEYEVRSALRRTREGN